MIVNTSANNRMADLEYDAKENNEQSLGECFHSLEV